MTRIVIRSCRLEDDNSPDVSLGSTASDQSEAVTLVIPKLPESGHGLQKQKSLAVDRLVFHQGVVRTQRHSFQIDRSQWIQRKQRSVSPLFLKRQYDLRCRRHRSPRLRPVPIQVSRFAGDREKTVQFVG